MNFDEFGKDMLGGSGRPSSFRSGGAGSGHSGNSFADRHASMMSSTPREPSSGLWLAWQIAYPICLGLLNFCLVVGAWLWFKHPLYLFRLLRWLQTRRAGLRCRQIQLDGTVYRIAEKGRADKFRTSMLLIHGLADDVSSWNSFVELIDAQAEHCLAVELPGHGGSLASSAEEFDLEPLARRVRSLVCAAGYEKQPMHVIGYSMGACVAGAYAALYPEQADLLTVAAPLMRQPSATEEANTELLHRLSSWLAPASYDELTVALRHRAYRPVPVASQVLTGMLEDRLPKLEFHRALLANCFEEANCNILLRLAEQITAATHIIWGKQDELSLVSLAGQLQKSLPNVCQSDILDECGHSLELECPANFFGLVYKFRKNQSLKKFS
ncbi:hypothetical protein BOX15_Mlig004013g3 [Macrostomum lignano]|uniref:acylglycerol lipase n=2 Tax=Macrostomum lignano TaxID=282301 RepID=A0A1I8IAE4_9PLAT|nr:hypothetical protein BOX15_Mlig004013g3 [Macrostomum lignano]